MLFLFIFLFLNETKIELRLLVHCWKSNMWTSLYPPLPFTTVDKRYQVLLNQPDASQQAIGKKLLFFLCNQQEKISCTL